MAQTDDTLRTAIRTLEDLIGGLIFYAGWDHKKQIYATVQRGSDAVDSLTAMMKEAQPQIPPVPARTDGMQAFTFLFFDEQAAFLLKAAADQNMTPQKMLQSAITDELDDGIGQRRRSAIIPIVEMFE